MNSPEYTSTDANIFTDLRSPVTGTNAVCPQSAGILIPNGNQSLPLSYQYLPMHATAASHAKQSVTECNVTHLRAWVVVPCRRRGLTPEISHAGLRTQTNP